MAQDLNKIFLNVPETKKDEFNTTEKLSEHERQIAFIHGAGTIATHGEIFTGGTSAPITVAGGPLADDSNDNWPEDWKDAAGNKQIPANTSLQEILTQLFLKTVPGTLGEPDYAWNPILKDPSLTVKQGTNKVSNNAHLPLGTILTVTFSKNDAVDTNSLKQTVTVTSTQGYFKNNENTHKPGNYTETVTCSYDVSDVDAKATWGSTPITSGAEITLDVTGDKKVTVNNGTATFTANNFTGITLWPSSNTKTKLTTGSKTISGIGDLQASKTGTSKAELTVHGYKPVFYGKHADTNIASTFWTVETMTSGDYTESNENAPRTQNMVTGDGTIFIALPDTHDYYNSTLKWEAAASRDTLGTVETTTVNFKHPNTNTTTPYKVFYVTNAATWKGNDVYELVWS